MAHDHHPVGLGGLVHVVGDEDDGHPRFLPETADGLHDLGPAGGVQHGGGLVHDDAPGAHGQDSGDGHPLLLSPGEEMGGVAGKGCHAHGGQALVHPLADLRRGEAHVFAGKGHILLHHGGDDLVVGVLEDHPRRLAHVEEMGFVGGIHPAHKDFAPRGEQNGVHVLGQGGFPAAVVAQDGHEGALLKGKADAVQGEPALFLVVGEAQVPGLDDGWHVTSLPSSGWRGRRGA